jgi:ribosomal protein L40E
MPSEGVEEMSTKVKEFGSVKDYENWLNTMGDRIRVINLSTSRKKWSPWTGMMNLENAQTYTVTFEELPPPQARSSPAQKLSGKQEITGNSCTKCGAANPPDTRFCGNCGSSLIVPEMQTKEEVCTQCGTPNPPEYKFCGKCGTPLFKPSANL